MKTDLDSSQAGRARNDCAVRARSNQTIGAWRAGLILTVVARASRTCFSKTNADKPPEPLQIVPLSIGRSERQIFRLRSGALIALIACLAHAADPAPTVVNGTFDQGAIGAQPSGYVLRGNAVLQYVGDPSRDAASRGVALRSYSGASTPAGSVAQTVRVPAGTRSFRFSIRGLPEEGFAIARDGKLYLRVDFLDSKGASIDAKTADIYSAIEQSRHDLNANGNNRTGGAATWRNYSLDFAIPFPQVTQLTLSVGFEGGAGKRQRGSDFYVDDFNLAAIPDLLIATTQPVSISKDSMPSNLIPLGGRWYYAASIGQLKAPAQFDSSNADRVLYFDGRYEQPFANNTTAWLHAGNYNLAGQRISADSFVPDNVTIRFDSSSLIMHTHGVPNHPTGKFPQDRGNPNPIAEQDSTYYLPLDPKPNAKHFVTDTANTNHALNMGPIGVAANGVVFFNPFDMGSQDATNFMDACCGHPNQDGQYHYHKYPICVNTPWTDAGETHSPLLGWAFDGYPIYGPYEGKDQMAKDVVGEGKLNTFNMHYDAERGWHYHVTPGRFPYIIGGYWGTADRRDIGPPRRLGGANNPNEPRDPQGMVTDRRDANGAPANGQRSPGGAGADPSGSGGPNGAQRPDAPRQGPPNQGPPRGARPGGPPPFGPPPE